MTLTQEQDAELARLTGLHNDAARKGLEHWRAEKSFAVGPGKRRKFQAIYPVVAHTLNQVSAALILRESEHYYAARANLRVAFEYALAAQWVAHTHKGEDELVGTMTRHHRNIVSDLHADGHHLPPELQRDLEPPSDNVRLPSSLEIAARFDTSKGTYSIAFPGAAATPHSPCSATRSSTKPVLHKMPWLA